MKAVLLVGTFDTKGQEYLFVRALLTEAGLSVRTLNVGCSGEPFFTPDIDADYVARAAGEDPHTLRLAADRGKSVLAMERGAAALAPQLAGEISGVLALGGSAGTTICTAFMRALPLGMPKIMVSSVASRDISPYIGRRDIFMLNSVVDTAGLNVFSRRILRNAAAALLGMLRSPWAEESACRKIQVAASMFGVTTPCLAEARKYLESHGCEVMFFHANGGGAAMENMIDENAFDAVLDATTTEWADECVGGARGAGPMRLCAAGRKGLPRVISLGALDMVNFGPADTVPARFSGRLFYQHNSTVTLMRTTAEECAEIGRRMAANLNQGKGKAVLFVPLGGLSTLDMPGKSFWNAEALGALALALRTHCLPERVEIIESPLHINDPELARAMAERLLCEVRNASQSRG